MRVLVCGGRTYSDTSKVHEVLNKIHPIDVIISGHAKGADTLGELYAWDQGIPVEIYHADWARYGRGAGPVRNKQMLTEGKPDLVVAFPGGRGTANMVRQARAANVKVKEIAK